MRLALPEPFPPPPHPNHTPTPSAPRRARQRAPNATPRDLTGAELTPLQPLQQPAFRCSPEHTAHRKGIVLCTRNTPHHVRRIPVAHAARSGARACARERSGNGSQRSAATPFTHPAPRWKHRVQPHAGSLGDPLHPSPHRRFARTRPPRPCRERRIADQRCSSAPGARPGPRS